MKAIEILIRAKDLTARAFAGVQKGVGRLVSGVRRMGGAIGRTAKQAAAALGLLGGAALGAGKYFIKFASDAEEIDTKFRAVYKSTITLANALTDKLAKDFDLAGSTAKQMMADTGDILTGFGFAGEEALKLSEKVNRLAVDLASFTNYSGGAAGASVALTKLMLGEGEQAKSLGIVVRQTSKEFRDAVQAHMAATGVSETQAKAVVALEMAYRQSKNAVGDYERTQEGVANRQRKATEAIKEAKEAIGAAIVQNSSYADILNTVAEEARKLAESGYIELWAENVRRAIEVIAPGLKSVGKAFSWVKTRIQEGAAFAGGFAGAQGGLRERWAAGREMAATIPAKMAEETRARLELIRQEKEAAKAKIEAEDRATEQLEKQKELAEQKAQAEVRAAQAKEEAARKEMEAARKVTDLEAQREDILIGQKEEAVAKQQEVIEGQIERLRKEMEFLALPREERRARERAERDATRDEERRQKKVERLRERERRGARLSLHERELLAEDTVRGQFAEQMEKRKVEEQNQRILDEQRADRRRKDMIARLDDIKREIDDVMRAA